MSNAYGSMTNKDEWINGLTIKEEELKYFEYTK